MAGWLRRHGWLVLFVPLSLLLFANVVGTYFHSDDFELLFHLKHKGPFGILSGSGQSFFRPLVSLSLWAELKIWGLNPIPFRITNILLHAGSAAWVTVIAAQIFGRLRPGFVIRNAWPAGLIFLCLSCHSEAVAWVSARTDALATFFALGAIAFALRNRGHDRWISGAFLTLGMLSKESVIAVPMLLGLYSLLCVEPKEERRPLLQSSGILVLVVVAMIGVRWLAIGKLIGGYGVQPTVSSMTANMGLYLAKTLMPGSLQILVLSPLQSVTLALLQNPKAAALALVLILAIAIIFARRSFRPPEWRFMGFALLGFFTLALPSLPLGMSKYTAEGERFLYLPSLTVCLAIGYLILRNRSTVARYVVLAIVAIPHVLALYTQNMAWANAGEDAKRTIESAPKGSGVVATAPDSYRGAYVLRNGLPEAIALRDGLDNPSLTLLTTYSYESRNETPHVSVDDHRFELTPGEPGPGSLLYKKVEGEPGGPTILSMSPVQAVITAKGSIQLLTPQGLRTINPF